jgi:D-alanine-D-alanine ligase
VSANSINQFGKVAVLAGGNSREREISLQSGKAVLDALLATSVDAELVDTQVLDLEYLKKFDRAFIALHGIGGEDGRIQALLEALDIPYTGSGIAASAIAMDKVLCKKIWKSSGFLLADSYVVKNELEAQQAADVLGLPVIFKPSLEGSSVGITKVDSENEIANAFLEANKPNQQVIVEKFILGEEYSVGILGDEVLPSVRLTTERAFYDYEAKYIDDDTKYFCPSGLSDVDEQAIQEIALASFYDLSCSGWGRVDFIRDESGKFYLLEINTVPGLTSHSLVPMEAKNKGYLFSELIVRILESSLTGAKL